MAAPWVSGAAASSIDMNPALTPAKVAKRLRSTVASHQIAGTERGRLDTGAEVACGM